MDKAQMPGPDQHRHGARPPTQREAGDTAQEENMQRPQYKRVLDKVVNRPGPAMSATLRQIAELLKCCRINPRMRPNEAQEIRQAREVDIKQAQSGTDADRPQRSRFYRRKPEAIPGA